VAGGENSGNFHSGTSNVIANVTNFKVRYEQFTTLTDLLQGGAETIAITAVDNECPALYKRRYKQTFR
jgi:hypothetical protein